MKQAVVLVHGMGEQTPMETLRGFVETMWVRNPDIDARRWDDRPEDGNPIWWKPDPRTGSFELARITTRAGHGAAGTYEGPRTDFYELYWADLTAANTIEQLRDWFMALLWRRPLQVPPKAMASWIVLWALTIAFAGLALWHGLAGISRVAVPGWVNAAFTLITTLYGLSIGAALRTFGDVARYVRAKPPNIAARRAIRERGLALLRTLSDSHDYDRLVLVGHSLGSIIAYDLLKLFWAEREAARTMVEGDALHRAYGACADVAAALAQAGDGSAERLPRFRAAQQDVFAAMQDRPREQGPWLISDFVTIGSPLTDAAFLLAPNQAELNDGIRDRRFPVSPPVTEAGGGFLYRPRRATEPALWRAHHAALFAAVRWTNLYDPAFGIVFGDPIAGPVAPLFGPGIDDVPVHIRRDGGVLPPRFFTHTLYWTATGTDAAQLPALRKSLDLIRRQWGAHEVQSIRQP